MGSHVSALVLNNAKHKKIACEYCEANANLVKESFDIFQEVIHSEKFLSFNQFDEVFGLFLGDTEDHFEVFLVDHALAVNAYEFFGAVILLLDVDLSTKINLLYGIHLGGFEDEHVSMEYGRVESMINDAVFGLQKALILQDIPDSLEILFETLPGIQDKRPITISDLEEWASAKSIATNFLELIRSTVHALSSKNEAIEFFQNSALWGDEDSDGGAVDGIMDKNSLFPNTYLWEKKVLDLANSSWLDETFTLHCQTQCLIALKELEVMKLPFAVVKSSNKSNQGWSGILEFNSLVRYLLLLWPSIEVTYNQENQLVNTTLNGMVEKDYRARIKKVSSEFSFSTVQNVLEFAAQHKSQKDELQNLREKKSGNVVAPMTTQNLTRRASIVRHGDPSTPTKTFNPIYSFNFVFNCTLRFARGEKFIAVVPDKNSCENLLGVSKVHDVARLIMEDFEILHEKHKWSIGRCGLIRKPVVLSGKTTTGIEAFSLMQSMNIDGVAIVEDESRKLVMDFSWESFSSVVSRWPQESKSIPTELLSHSELVSFECLLDPIEQVFPVVVEPTVVNDSDSIASVVCLFSKEITTTNIPKVYRVYVVDKEQRPVGVVNLIDIIRFLIQEQAHYASSKLKG